MQDLFEHASDADRQAAAPLAARLRPRSLDQFLGQEHIVGPGAPLGAALRHDRLWSVILWGPPGTGKTTLATIAATMTQSHFIAISAVTAGVADIREAVSTARASSNASTSAARSCSSMRSTASIKRSRTRCCPTSRTAP